MKPLEEPMEPGTVTTLAGSGKEKSKESQKMDLVDYVYTVSCKHGGGALKKKVKSKIRLEVFTAAGSYHGTCTITQQEETRH